ncbi:MAG TPA: M50 family metallopeptidase [Pyrinomonadaceae bacterium]|jgi:Zn-dependent protease|nr:M50 family metallopeptidase [Pyrinomonadaceae bacterium]
MNVLQLVKRQLTIARVYGIPVRIDYRWFAVVILSVWLIASNLQYHAIQLGNVRLPPHAPLTAWLLGLITTLGLFLSVFGHELAHALMARAEGIEIEEIVLHPFGGLARLKTEPQNPRAEFRIAFAGPASSFLFAMLAFVAAKIAAIGNYEATVVVFFLIASGNLLLALFNLFPGYPLDGGRVLRALLWRRSGDIKDATRKAGICGVLIGGVLVLFGVYILIAPNWRAAEPYFMGTWSILVGLFLLDTAMKVVKSARHARLVTVGEAMSAPIAIEPGLMVTRFVDDILPLHRQTSFPVAVNGRLHGILSLEDLKSLPRERWANTQVQSVMRLVEPGFFVEPSTTLDSAQAVMKENGVGAIAIVNARGELVGFLQSGSIKRRVTRAGASPPSRP